jgi:chromosome segregation ATPase
MLGLAPARSVASQAQLIAELKAGSLAWKTRASEAMARVKTLEVEVRHQSRLVNKLTESLDKLRQRQSEADHLARVRLAEAEQALAVAREHLMMVDVKLDILEGAANVLDVRTRGAISKQHSGITTPV